MPYMKIGGVDITRFIAMDGLSLSENDLDSPRSGRTLDAVMRRKKVAEKNKASVKFVPIKKSDADKILPILRSQYFTCETDFFIGQTASPMSVYCATRNYGVAIVDTQGVTWYKDIAFNMTQR